MINNNKNIFEKYWHYIVSFFFSSVFYFPFFLPNAILKMGDYYDQNLPNLIYATKCLRHGFFPYWTQNLFGGFPFMSDPQTAVFYPLHILYGFISNDVANTFITDKYIFFHWMLFGIAATFFSRSFKLSKIASVASAIVMSFNGYVVLHAGHTNIVGMIMIGLFGMGFLVRAIDEFDYRKAVASGLFFACTVFIGHSPTTFTIALAVLAGAAAKLIQMWFRHKSICMIKSAIIICVVSGVISFLGSFVQIILTSELLKACTRARLKPEEALMYSLPLKALPGLFFPNFYHKIFWEIPSQDLWQPTYKCWSAIGAWEYMFYIGFIAFVLGLLGFISNIRKPMVHFLFWSSILIVIYSLGQKGFVWTIFFNFVPGFKQIRIPPRLLWIFCIIWGLLAGLGVDALQKEASALARKNIKMVIVFLIATWALGTSTMLIVYFAKGNWFEAMRAIFTQNPDTLQKMGIQAGDFLRCVSGQYFLVTATATILASGLIAALLGKHKIAFPLILIALFGELFVYGFHKNIGYGEIGYRNVLTKEYLGYLDKPKGRILAIDSHNWFSGKNSSLVENMNYANGYNPMIIKWVAPFLPRENSYHGMIFEEKLLDTWNVSNIIFERREKTVLLDNKSLNVPDLFWAEICSNKLTLKSELSFDVDPDIKIKNIYLISTAKCVLSNRDYDYIAALKCVDERSKEIVDYPIRVGVETAEWTYEHNLNSLDLHHKKPPIAFYKSLDESAYPQGLFYLGKFEIPQSAAINKVIVKAVSPFPITLCVSNLVIEHEGGFTVYAGIEGLGHKLEKTDPPNYYIVKRSTNRGYAWIVPEAKSVTYKKKYVPVYANFCEPDFDPYRTVLLNKEDYPKSRNKAVTIDHSMVSHATFRSVIPHRASVLTSSNFDGWLVLSMTYYPGWRAYIDGKETKIYQANGAHVALSLEKGKHEIELMYEPPKFKIGFIATFLTWVGSIIFLIFGRGRKKVCA